MLTAIGTQTIETPRLILRRFAKGDGKSAFRNWCSDASVTTYLKWSAHSYPLITEQVVARWAREYHDPHCLHWAITRKSQGDVIGGVSLTVKDLLRHLGFRQEGLHRGMCRLANGQFVDCLSFGLCADERPESEFAGDFCID